MAAVPGVARWRTCPCVPAVGDSRSQHAVMLHKFSVLLQHSTAVYFAACPSVQLCCWQCPRVRLGWHTLSSW